jgi:hypothetical protein
MALVMSWPAARAWCCLFLGGYSQGIGTCKETDRTRPGLVIFTSQPWPDFSCAVTQTAGALRPGRC